MQHVFGRHYHRTTWWRRQKALEGDAGDGWVPGRKRKGRRPSEDIQMESFVRFTAAVIQNVEESGHCDYASIEQKERPPGSRFRYRAVPEALYHRLAGSGFPPAMMAVAICRIAPLNFKTRPGSKASRLTPREGALHDLKREKRAVTADSYLLAYKRRQLEEVLKRDGMPASDRETILQRAEDCHYGEDWVRVYLREHKSPDEMRATGQAPMKESCKGTPAHRVLFSGAQITRRMESYWKHHPRFKECFRFLISLFSRPDTIPRAPYKGGITMVDPELNEEFRLALKLRRNR
jgi:hypothetical protein